MTRAQEQRTPQPSLTRTGRADGHPAWCDLTRCTADSASQLDGYRSDRGEHQSAPIPVSLAGSVMLPVRDGMAWLSEACAPWTCDTYLRVQVGDVHLSLPADNARQILADLSALLCLATLEEVT